jgi:crossover junction endodeoxyribonuclease RusA
MLPFEFTVTGPPISHQSHNKTKLAAWRKRVRAAAAVQWKVAPLSVPLKIVVTYYSERPTARFDNDNMVKPIRDALIQLVCTDDRWITDTEVRRRDINGSYPVRHTSLVLLTAFSQGDQFLHVVIDQAPAQGAAAGM